MNAQMYEGTIEITAQMVMEAERREFWREVYLAVARPPMMEDADYATVYADKALAEYDTRFN